MVPRSEQEVRPSDSAVDYAGLHDTVVALLEKGEQHGPGDLITPEQAIKDPFVLEFLGLKDEYSKSELEARPVRTVGPAAGA
jgi:hypothetical protein